MAGKPIPSDLNELYHLRLLVLLECGDNKFRQIALTAKQFAKISEYIINSSTESKRKGNPFQIGSGVNLRDGWEKASDDFLGLYDFYEDVD